MKKIRNRVPITIALFSSFILVLAGTGLFRYWEYKNIYRSSKNLDQLTGAFEDRQFLFANLIKCFVLGRNDLETIIYHPNPVHVNEAKKRISADHKNILLELNNYKVLIEDSIEQRLYDNLLVTYTKIASASESVLDLFNHGRVAESREYDARVIQPMYAGLQDLNFQLSDYVKERDFQRGDDVIGNILKAITLSKYLTYTLSILLIVLGAIIVAAIRTIIRKRNLLVKSEEKYRIFIEQTHELISRTDMRGKAIFLNNKLKELLGYTDEELSRITVYDVVESDFLENMREDFKHRDKLDSKRMVSGSLKTKEGKRVYFEGSVLWEYKGNRFDGATVFLNDISARVLLEQNLKTSEKSFRKLFSMAPVPMITINPKTLNFMQINEAACKFYGYSSEEILSKSILDILPREDIPRTLSAISMIMEENWNYSGIHKHIKKDNSEVDVEIYATRIDISDSPLLLASVVDITERKQNESLAAQTIIQTHEEERFEIGDELEEKVSRQLTLAKINIELLKQFLPSDKKVREIYTETVSAIESATNETDNLSYKLAPVENSSFKEALEKLLEPFCQDNNYSVTFIFDQSVESFPLTQELKLSLYRILQEQLQNIGRHARTTAIKVEIFARNQGLWMLISDDGIGFDMKKIPVEISLINMKRRAALFRGEVKIDSEPGKGCDVLVTIPWP